MSRGQAGRQLDVDIEAATRGAGPALSLASGNEPAVRSPALELQEALSEMLASRAQPSPQPRAAVAVGLGLMSIAGVCGAFWVAVGRMLISLT